MTKGTRPVNKCRVCRWIRQSPSCKTDLPDYGGTCENQPRGWSMFPQRALKIYETFKTKINEFKKCNNLNVFTRGFTRHVQHHRVCPSGYLSSQGTCFLAKNFVSPAPKSLLIGFSGWRVKNKGSLNWSSVCCHKVEISRFELDPSFFCLRPIFNAGPILRS